MARRAGFVNREIARAASLQATPNLPNLPNLPKAFEHYKSALSLNPKHKGAARIRGRGTALMASPRHWFQSSHEN